MMVHLIGIIGAMLGACFTGAALYRSLADRSGTQPAGTTLLTALAIGSGIFGAATYVQGEDVVWLIAGALMLAAALRGKVPLARTLMGVIATLIYLYALVHL